jgi:S-adenosylmethionine synthetase
MPAQLVAAGTILPTHPDAVCDFVADALVDAATALDPRASCDVAVVLVGDALHVAGYLPEGVDVTGVVRPLVGEAPRILVEVEPGAASEHVVACGYAIDEPGTNYLPAEFWLARRLALRLPAGNDLIVLLEEDTHALRLAGFSCSLTADPTAPTTQRAVRTLLQDELAHLARRVPGFDPRIPESVAVHPCEPADHAGSGRHLAGSTYGPRVPMTVAGLCGKDLGHPARAGAIAARRLAKAVVRAGVARECHAVVTLVPGQEEAMIVALHGDGQRLDASRWSDLVDRSIRRIGARYSGAVKLADVARAGHFLREDWPWESVRFE